jgi:cell fate regulator YaaT (PSP1 superfamily)
LLCSKYKRALEIRATKTTLHATMRELGVESRDVFDTWRAREKTHLRTLSKEPKEETLEMEYLQKLINLRDAQYVFLFHLYPPFSHENAGTASQLFWG